MTAVSEIQSQPADPRPDEIRVPATGVPSLSIRDKSFLDYVDRLKRLHNFLYQEAIPLTPSDVVALQMGELHSLQADPNGRMPTADEWNQVEKQTQLIYVILSPLQRKKFLLSKAPQALVRLPAYLLVAAIFLIGDEVYVLGPGWGSPLLFFGYLLWTGCLGALGAIASLGMNALSIQDDITFDITNGGLMVLRVVLGALFAIVISMPFGYALFYDFCRAIATYPTPVGPGTVINPDLSQSSVMKVIIFLIPFVLGFSTSTVILILNQLTDGVQSLFGRRSSQEPRDVILPPKEPLPKTLGGGLTVEPANPNVATPAV